MYCILFTPKLPLRYIYVKNVKNFSDRKIHNLLRNLSKKCLNFVRKHQKVGLKMKTLPKRNKNVKNQNFYVRT